MGGHLALHDYLLRLKALFRELPASLTSAQLDSVSVHLARFDARFR
jgi:hypothetical protein